MSYVQGTVVIVDVTLTDPDTDAPADPADLAVTVFQPAWNEEPETSYTITYSGNEIAKTTTGKYRFSIDTSPAAGNWKYEVDATGAEAVIKQRQLRVTPRLSLTI